jgi:hypothetical protein
LFSIHSRKPWLLSVNSVPGSGRFAWALPNSPNRMGCLISYRWRARYGFGSDMQNTGFLSPP